MSRPRAFQLMEAASVIDNLSTMVDKPDNERQTRPLTALTPDEQRLAWEVVQQTAPDGKITAAHVKPHDGKPLLEVLYKGIQLTRYGDGTP